MDKILRIKKFSKIFGLVLSTLLALTLVSPDSARAGQLSVLGTSISWDDSTLYIPTSCSSYYFNYSTDRSLLMAHIEIANKYGDKIGTALITGGNGRASLQVCASYEFIGLTVSLNVKQSSSFGGAEQTVTAPITFRERGASGGSGSSVAKPAPAPTVTVTAAAPVDSTLQDKYDALLSDYNNASANLAAANAKIKKICANKPKPKGC